MDLQNNQVYNEIAYSFSDTRTKLWDSLIKFFNTIPSHKTYLDVGCGNGRNMQYRHDLISYGCDYTQSFIDICLSKNLNVKLCDCRKLTYDDNYFDYSISSAVLHHLNNIDEVIIAIKEMLRVSKEQIYISVFSIKILETKLKKNLIKHNDKNDYILPWKSISNKIYDRYYHLFDKNEINYIIQKCNLNIVDLYEDDYNWIIIAKK